jgi:hypothetical protein
LPKNSSGNGVLDDMNALLAWVRTWRLDDESDERSMAGGERQRQTGRATRLATEQIDHSVFLNTYVALLD